MRITVLAFGIAKEIMNGSSVEMEIDADADAGMLKNLLEQKYPRLKELRSFLIAINNEYAHSSEPVSQTDEIAVIPPVSGG
jgi:molybdopterin converting factor subunit 1